MAYLQEFTISDSLWTRLEPLLPVYEAKPHPLGCYGPRMPDRQVLTAVFYLLRTGCSWKGLNETGLGRSSTVHQRFNQWVQQGVFAKIWEEALHDYDDMLGVTFPWMTTVDSHNNAATKRGGKRVATSKKYLT